MAFESTERASGPTADVTVDAPPGALLRASSSGGSNGSPTPAAHVALVEGSTPEIAGEVVALLRGRLRIAALVLAFGFAVFLIRALPAALRPVTSDSWVYLMHVAVTLTLGAIGLGMCHRKPMSAGVIRGVELLVFGLPAVYCLTVQCLWVLEQSQLLLLIPAALRPRLHLSGGVWLVLMYTYALFIPNAWPRAAVVIGAIALAPVLLLGGLIVGHADVAQVAGWPLVVQMALITGTASVGAVVGVHTINNLRREAFELRQLGQYKLKRLLGTGGMGEVYLAEHQMLKRPCAIKLIRPGESTNPRVLARFQREVRATARLSHWNTVEIFDYGRTSDGTFYYVMEHLPGMSLAEMVERFGPLPPERVVYFLRQACDALHEAHAMGLIHRDIKPGNVFAAQRGGVYDVAKLLDFGLVKPLVETDDEAGLELTVEGAITGSPLYMSPEQAAGETEPDVRSDIYSLGATGYFLLTGRPPFTSEKPIKLLIAHIRDAVTPPSEIRPGVPADVESVVLRCLAKNPEERFQNAQSLERALSECECAGLWTRDLARQWWQDKPVAETDAAFSLLEGA